MVTKKKSDSTEKKIDKKEENDTVEIPVGKFFGKVRSNPWMASTIVLGIVVILVLAFGGAGTGGVATVSADEAGERVLEFLNSNPQITGEVTLVSAEESGQFYEVVLSYQGQQVPVYTTLDGEFLVGNPVALGGNGGAGNSGEATAPEASNEPQADTSVPKSNKPVVELFVMSHCPFGTQIEKGMIPVVELLGDKIDFELKFVNYAMHGEKEVWEQARQYCIQEEQNDKFLPYLRCFLEADDSEACLAEVGVDTDMMDACVERIDEEFELTDNLEDQSKWANGRFPRFMVHNDENEEYGVRGSPTLVINGQQASSGRDSASLLGTICAAFNEAPEECDTELSSASPSPGFGWEELSGSGGAAAAAQCG